MLTRTALRYAPQDLGGPKIRARGGCIMKRCRSPQQAMPQPRIPERSGIYVPAPLSRALLFSGRTEFSQAPLFRQQLPPGSSIPRMPFAQPSVPHASRTRNKNVLHLPNHCIKARIPWFCFDWIPEFRTDRNKAPSPDGSPPDLPSIITGIIAKTRPAQGISLCDPQNT